MGQLRLHITVRGRVQGVGYRFFVVKAAEKRGLTGWVRNCSNGDVECQAQGPEEQLELFLTELERGPSWAHVISVDHERISQKTNEKGYEIVH